ncbi:MAG: PhoH family protein [Candidatus Absconditabacteria bacterium]|nr:PhoH family protein [Candidatus Absconditabacteria bacterium]MDD4714458.1 PhoH family protein [Candidatus Absconditabacteria bacterium]
MENLTENKGKIYVLDTNIIGDDYLCLDRFDEHNIYISTVSLDEIDNHKKDDNDFGFNIRGFVRELEPFFKKKTFYTKGCSLGRGKGKVRLISFDEESLDYKKVRKIYRKDCSDHKLLASCLTVMKNNPDKEVVLVTKDNLLRGKAGSFGIKAENYKYHLLRDKKNLENKVTEVFNGDIEKVGIIKQKYQPRTNSYLLVDNHKYYKWNGENIEYIGSWDHEGNKPTGKQGSDWKFVANIKPLNWEQLLGIHSLMDEHTFISILAGDAGSGKTLLALAVAIELYKAKRIDTIWLTRPNNVAQNRDMGFLPGNKEEKFSVFLEPFNDAVEELIRAEKSKNNKNETKVTDEEKQDFLQKYNCKPVPYPYLKGRTFHNSAIILDESQDASSREMKKICTRIGRNCKLFILGDITQIDSQYESVFRNGLSYTIDRLLEQSFCSYVHLPAGPRSEISKICAELL